MGLVGLTPASFPRDLAIALLPLSHAFVFALASRTENFANVTSFGNTPSVHSHAGHAPEHPGATRLARGGLRALIQAAFHDVRGQ